MLNKPKKQTRLAPSRNTTKNKKTTNKLCGRVMRGRYFSPRDIRLIQRTVEKNYDHGRTGISQVICKLLNWVQPNGWLKDRACRDVLLLLEKEGHITLPPCKIIRTFKQKSNRNVTYLQRVDDSPIDNLNLSSLELVLVKGKKDELFWNWLVDKYHYLGFRLFVGRTLKYLAYVDDRVVGAIGWCDPAWSVSARDVILNELGIDRTSARNHGINNGRFLILPWVTVPNLASYILSIAIKEASRDWLDYYSIKPLYLETFVDPSKFFGTCYKAANWIQLGLSKGYRKSGQNHTNSQTPKIYFIYPLGNMLRTQINKIIRGVDNSASVK
jgi:hypothetical protein